MLNHKKPLKIAAAVAALFLSHNALALTVYSAGPGKLIDTLAADFKKATGIQVDVFQADTGKVMARLQAEASNPRADVVISASWDSAQDLDRRGWLLPFQSANAAQVPAQYKQPAYVAQALSALSIVWNSKSGTPRPADWSDLTLPAFKDKVTMPDPAQSGASLDLLSGLQSRQNERAWQLFKALKENGMIIAGPNAQAMNPVLQGSRAAVFGAVDYVALGNVAKGESVEVIFPRSGTVIAPRPMMILKSSKTPDDARKFIDYVLSPQGQARVAEAYLIPARADIAIQRPALKDIKLLPESPDAANVASRAALLHRFSSLFGRK
ncbi:ABC transporter substrate-binding protein [Herbaspirillum sp. alder98]|uniref:ABC transporter substrate-binding protein n=1 Tax=Herbaspirillum sp. alder98 TaxID=2913096 RepID=UPI001CD8AB92|nr:ABC transporter substrate-binding protein [Herbaspirillum sp. alder98]MCA1326927.1 ABC transporter substrate-binding protein [Herbaspirillum sp. alder98]